MTTTSNSSAAQFALRLADRLENAFDDGSEGMPFTQDEIDAILIALRNSAAGHESAPVRASSGTRKDERPFEDVLRAVHESAPQVETKDSDGQVTKCDHEWEFQDDSFDHEFGTEQIHYFRCKLCDAERDMESGDYYDE